MAKMATLRDESGGRPNPPGIQETTCFDCDPGPQRSASSHSPAYRAGIVTHESPRTQCFHTWSNSGSGHTQGPANQLSKVQRGSHGSLAITERGNGTVCRAGCLTEDDSDMHS